MKKEKKKFIVTRGQKITLSILVVLALFYVVLLLSVPEEPAGENYENYIKPEEPKPRIQDDTTEVVSNISSEMNDAALQVTRLLTSFIPIIAILMIMGLIFPMIRRVGMV